MPAYQSAPKFSFTIDDKPYVLNGIGVGQLEQMAELENMPKQIVLSVLLGMFEKHSDKRTREAVASLDQNALMQLFKDWTGGDLGESQGLPESTEITGEQ